MKFGGRCRLVKQVPPIVPPAIDRKLQTRRGDWWPGRELNPRHADFQSAALPTELPGRTEPRIKQGGTALVNYCLRINELAVSSAWNWSASRGRLRVTFVTRFVAPLGYPWKTKNCSSVMESGWGDEETAGSRL
jgi:hypothetical protein